MAGQTKVNGFGEFLTGSVRTHGESLGFFKVTARSTSNGSNTAVDLRAQDDATDELVEGILKATNAVAHFARTANAGVLAIVTANHNHTAAELAAVIEDLDGVGTDTIVEVADQLTFK